MNDEKMAELFRSVCSQCGIKRTMQRYAVFEAVYGNHSHPTVDDIYRAARKKIPMIKSESVYRILSDFHKAGIVEQVGVPGIMRYEYKGDPHGHFACVRCGKIIDIKNFSFEPSKELEGVVGISFTLNGLCPACAKDGQDAKRSPF